MRSLLVVPTPLRAQRIARRLCDADGGVLFGARVVTPEALLPGLLAAAGERRPLATPLAERLLASEAGAEPGGPFDGLPPAGGLAAALASAIAELRRGEVTAARLAEAADRLPARAGERLRALARALARYEERLAEAGLLDRAAAFRAAAAALRRGTRSEELGPARGEGRLELLVAEGFAAPPAGEWDLLAALAVAAGRARFRIPSLAERPDLCGGAEPMIRRVEALHAEAVRAGLELALDAVDERAPLLARLLRGLGGGPGGGPAGDGESFTAQAGAGEQGEAELAARLLAGMLERGLAPDELLLFSADPAAPPLLRRACRALGVPLATAGGGPLAEAQPVRAVRAALEEAVAPGREPLLALAGSSYLPLGPGADRLPLWLDRAGATADRGSVEERLRRRARALAAGRPERQALLAAAEAVAALGQRLGAFRAPATAARFAAALQELVGPVRRRAARGDPEEAASDLAALERLSDAAEGVARARGLAGRGPEPLEAAAWLGLLDLAVAGLSRPPTGEPAAGAVELWPLHEAPGLSARGAVVMGCARGRFPAPQPPEPLLREAERQAVNGLLGRGALRTAGARRADGLLAAVSALAAGREAVACTWAGPGPEGPGGGAAPLLAEAAALAGSPLLGPAPDPDLAGSRSEGEALRAAVRAAGAGRGAEALGALAEAAPGLALRAGAALARGALEEERARAVEERRASPASGAVPAAALAPALPEEWSPTQLETWARCPFRLFLGLGLRLREPEGAGLDIDGRDEGRLVHAVLERFHRERIACGEGPLRGTAAEQEALGAAAEEVFRRFEAEGAVGDPAVWSARRGALLGRLQRVVEAEALDPTGLTPALVEHAFGGGKPHGPLRFADGDGEVLLRGRLDRVDAGPDALLAIDYKNSRNGQEHAGRLERDAIGVTSFQLPAYLLAAAEALPGRRRLQASYLLLRSAERLAPLELDAGDPLLSRDPAVRAREREEGRTPFADAVLGAVRRIRRGDLPVASRDCEHCGFGAVCRFERAAEGEP